MKGLMLAIGTLHAVIVFASTGCKSHSVGPIGYGVSVRHERGQEDVMVVKTYAQYTVVNLTPRLKFDFELQCDSDRGTILMMLSPREGAQVLIDEIPIVELSKTLDGLSKASFIVECKRGDHAKTQLYDLYRRHIKTVSSNEVLTALDRICAIQVQVVEDSFPKK